MSKQTAEVESVVFQALSHPVRRTLISVLDVANQSGVSYTELITELGLPTGKMNYHLEQLEGLIEKNPEHLYILTSLGKKAANQLRQLHLEVNDEDRQYLQIAEKIQNRSIAPTIRAFIGIGIATSSVVFAVLVLISFVVLTDGGTPLFVFVLIPVIMAIDAAIIVTLMRALKSAPRWLRGLEKKFNETIY